MYRLYANVKVPKDFLVKVKGTRVFLSLNGRMMFVSLNEKLKLSLLDSKILKLEFSMLKVNKRRVEQLISILYSNKRDLENAIFGLSFGFVTRIRLEGIGYKAKVENSTLKFKLGYSHDIVVKIPPNIKVSVFRDTALVLKSFSRKSIGIFKAHLERFRVPNAYDNKGVVIEGKIYQKKKVKKK